MTKANNPLQTWKEHRRNLARQSIPLAGQTCDFCGASENLSRHHISYRPAVIKILCVTCHAKLHQPDFRKLKPRRLAKSCNGKIYLERFYFLKEVSKLLNVSLKELHAWRRENQIPAWEEPHGPRFKGYWGRTLITVQALAHELRRQKTPPNKVSKSQK